jgi:hypothetical protein
VCDAIANFFFPVKWFFCNFHKKNFTTDCGVLKENEKPGEKPGL